MKKQVAVMIFLSITSSLFAMTAGQKLMRRVIGDYFKASQQKSQIPQDYDYELTVEQRMGTAYQTVLQEKCRNGQVAGELVVVHTSTVPHDKGYGASQKLYYGPMDSQELREKMVSAGTCFSDDKVCSPAGMCICTNATTRIWRNELKKK